MFSFPLCHWSTAAAGASSIIQSIQQVQITIGLNAASNTATISSVNTSNTVLLFNGQTTNSTNPDVTMCRVALTNGTTVTATRGASSSGVTTTVRCTVLEFTSAAVTTGAQTGTITIAAASTSNTATISTVGTTRTWCVYQGLTTTNTSINNSTFTNLELTNATTVTAARNGSSNNAIIGYTIIELSATAVDAVRNESGTFSTNATAPTVTITSTVTARSTLSYNGITSAVSAWDSSSHRLALTNSTTVTCTRTGTSTSTRVIKFQVIQWATGVLNSLQTGTTALAFVTSATSTITSVNTSKSVITLDNFNTSVATNSTASSNPAVVLTNSTTVTGENGLGGSTTTPAWEVLEFV